MKRPIWGGAWTQPRSLGLSGPQSQVSWAGQELPRGLEAGIGGPGSPLLSPPSPVALPPLLPRPATIQPQPGSPDVSCSDGVSCSRFGLGSVLATFPPAHPDTLTAAQLCAPGLTGPRYTDLPKSSHAHLLRQANALASFDSAVKECCQRPEPLGCAKQAVSALRQRLGPGGVSRGGGGGELEDGGAWG